MSSELIAEPAVPMCLSVFICVEAGKGDAVDIVEWCCVSGGFVGGWVCGVEGTNAG